MRNKTDSSGKRPRRRPKRTKTTSTIEALSSGETLPDLPQEIITEILVRLPVKSLLRFKCVAKSWHSLISSPDFIKAHSTYSTLDPTLSNYRFLLGISYSPDNAKLGAVSSVLLRDVLNDAAGVRRPRRGDTYQEINGSCNGLLCVSMYHHGTSDVFLWNPCLRISKKLPPLRSTESNYCSKAMYGVAYDERNDDYKVVGLKALGKPSAVVVYKTAIYSLKNDSWKAIEDYKGGHPTSFTSSMIYANGKVHFLAYFTLDYLSFVWNIVSLDVENEVYGSVEHPNVEQPKYDIHSHISIGGFKGCISVLYSYADGYIDVWVLKEYGVRESWSKAVRIPYYITRSLRNNLYSHNLCVSSNGKILLVYGSYLVVYNPEDYSFKYPKIGGRGPMEIYVESLVSLPTMI